jgi:broad specificity phosphatase PhoE
MILPFIAWFGIVASSSGPEIGSLYFVRHGETLANASGHYSSATVNVFSKLGQEEVDTLTASLLKLPRFDLILVSPSPRALRTIAPYLEKTRQRATIWPLLYECCTGRKPKDAKPTRFSYGPKISVPRDLIPYFRLMSNETRLPNSPDYGSGLAQVNASVKEFIRQWRGERVLLVGHSGQGGHFLHELTGKWIQLKNAELHQIFLEAVAR